MKDDRAKVKNAIELDGLRGFDSRTRGQGWGMKGEDDDG